MASRARSSFLVGVEALRTSIDSSLVTAGDTVGAFLRRGLTIVSYNLLEAFMVERSIEVAAHINSGLSHFTDLPEKLQKAAAQDLLRIAQSQLQWSTGDLQSKLDYTREIGESLASNTRALRLSPLMWQWSGSNMRVEDFARSMKLFHVESPWDVIGEVAQRVGSPIPDPRSAMDTLFRERNKCAHQSSYSVSNLWIRAVPSQILHFALGADISISVGANKMNRADGAFYQDEAWFKANKVIFRFVQERKGKWAEIVEGSSKATRVSADRDTAIRAAILAASGKLQVVVVQDAARQTLDWTYPEFP